jgi:hypothetical protein
MIDEIQIIELSMEYKLTLAVRAECACGPYLVMRQSVLFPEVLKRAEQYGEEPAQLFHRFSNRIHAALCEKANGTPERS